jgi:hypothetical protein
MPSDQTHPYHVTVTITAHKQRTDAALSGWDILGQMSFTETTDSVGTAHTMYQALAQAARETAANVRALS